MTIRRRELLLEGTLTLVQKDNVELVVDKKQRVWLPKSLQRTLVKCWHEYLGHPGEQKSLTTFTKFWLGNTIYTTIKESVRSCYACQVNKRKTHRYGRPEKPNRSQKFNQLVTSDIVGPYVSHKFTDNFEKNKFFCITVIDVYSRFTKIAIIENINAKSIQQIFRDWIKDSGPPMKLITESGSQYVSYVFQQFLEQNSVAHYPTPSYHPQGNGISERLNFCVNNLFRIWRGAERFQSLRSNWEFTEQDDTPLN